MSRWMRLGAAVTAMIMIGNLQYAWTLFVQPMMSATGWKLSQVQWGFTFFIAVMTWSMPLSGWLIDRIGPRVFMSLAGVLCAVGWGSLGHARSLTEFYALYSVAGLGNAFVYCCSIAVALKWFPDKRGLASGIIAGGYGSGAALFIPIFSYLIHVTDLKKHFRLYRPRPRPADPDRRTISRIPAARFGHRVCACEATRTQVRRRIQFLGDAADTAILRALRHDADSRDRRPDVERPGGADCA